MATKKAPASKAKKPARAKARAPAKAPAKKAAKAPAKKAAKKPAKKAAKAPAKKLARKPAKKPAEAPAKSAAAKPGTSTSSKSTRWALLLRGINVGTKNTLPMAELRTMLATIGCTQVATYVQSGNAVLTTTLTAAALTSAIESALAGYMGRPIATTLRTRAQLAAVVHDNPFAELAADPANHAHLCVTFLGQQPAAGLLAPLLATDFAPERLHVSGSELFTWHPDGQARSSLAAAIGKLRIPGAITTRNWRTVTTLLAMLSDA